MGFWAYQRSVWLRAVNDARQTAMPHSLVATVRLGVVLLLTTLAMVVANESLHIVDRGLMSEDNIKDNLITLGIFVPVALVVLFVGLVVIEGLFIVPYKMWKEAKAAPRKADVDPYGQWDWNLEQMSAYLRSRGLGWDTDYSVCNSALDRLRNARLHLEARLGDPQNENTWSEHKVIIPADWKSMVFHEGSFDLPARMWRTHSQALGNAAYVDFRVRSAQVLKEWPPGVGQSIADTIQPRPRVWVRHLETKGPAHYSEPGEQRSYRHSWEAKVRSLYAAPTLRLAVKNAVVLDFNAELSGYYVPDEQKPFEIEITNPPPKFTFYADTTEPAAPQITCEFIT